MSKKGLKTVREFLPRLSLGHSNGEKLPVVFREESFGDNFGFRMFFAFTVMILSSRTDMPGQTVQTQIRLQSGQGLHCLPFCLHHMDSLLYGRAT